MLIDLMKKSRTNRFFTKKQITEAEILSILETARYAPSAMNAQNVSFTYTVDPKVCSEVFKTFKLGGLLKDKPGESEAPTGYIVLCQNTDIKFPQEAFFLNMGLIAQNINLMANELGYSICIVGSYNKAKLDEIFKFPENIKSCFLIVIGEGKDKTEIVDARHGEKLGYYRENGKHYIPKLVLEDMIHRYS